MSQVGLYVVVIQVMINLVGKKEEKSVVYSGVGQGSYIYTTERVFWIEAFALFSRTLTDPSDAKKTERRRRWQNVTFPAPLDNDPERNAQSTDN